MPLLLFVTIPSFSTKDAMRGLTASLHISLLFQLSKSIAADFTFSLNDLTDVGLASDRHRILHHLLELLQGNSAVLVFIAACNEVVPNGVLLCIDEALIFLLKSICFAI